MKVRDLSEWQGQKAAFAADTSPLASRFEKFIETWAETAEDFLRHRPDEAPIEALRTTLGPAELHTEHFSIGFVGQALLLLVTHWEPIADRDAFYDSMTHIEQHLFNDSVIVWQAAQAAKAQQDGS